MIDSFVEIDGKEVHLQLTDENSHTMIVFDNLTVFLDFMQKLLKQSRELHLKIGKEKLKELKQK